MATKQPRPASPVTHATLKASKKLGRYATGRQIADAAEYPEGCGYDSEQVVKNVGNLAMRGILNKKEVDGRQAYQISKLGEKVLQIPVAPPPTADALRKRAERKANKEGKPRKEKTVQAVQPMHIPEYNVSLLADQFGELATALITQNNTYRQIAVQVIRQASADFGKDDVASLRNSLLRIIGVASTILNDDEREQLKLHTTR